MKKTIFIALCLMSINMYSQDDIQIAGIGVTGNTFLSPTKKGEMYYGVMGSINVRDNSDSFLFKMNVGTQFHELARIIDIGFTLRLSLFKYAYIGASPYTYRIIKLKETEGTENEIYSEKNYGIAHLGASIPITPNFKFELETNYNYFYKSKAAGYGFAVGLVIYEEAIFAIFGGM